MAHGGADGAGSSDLQERLPVRSGFAGRVRGEDHPGGAAVPAVTDADGNPAGSVRRHASTAAAVDILDADGGHLVHVVYGRVHRVPGVRYLGTAGDQPAVAVSSHCAMIVRFDPGAPEALRVLVFAQLQGAGWLSMSRFRREVRPRPGPG
ncbi:hypothetical protein [Phytomonospora endophytica]|uniref:Uncharacterized protein n=1 Tax=Phytomonospora endophytica TaxID=714109 RepID=A0A841G6L1_9ACTN|nr:hypothetical protein [Phytomonospora endophytica]MBB6039710.1 hypothetical protein [Phytomonospora endophytica]